jgi:hypothetical protein
MAKHNWFISLAGYEVGDYSLIRYVGKGRIGYVYQARHKEISDWEVAIKINKGRLRDGWQNELKKVSALSTIHGVVHFHGVGAVNISHEKHSETLQYTFGTTFHLGEA